jgi:hypothetical protein
MGAVFAATSQAPITAVLIIFELTGDYSIILPLMTAVVIATALSKRWSHDTIYTLKLRRRGIDLMRGRPASLLETISVADAMLPVPHAVSSHTPLAELSPSTRPRPQPGTTNSMPPRVTWPPSDRASPPTRALPPRSTCSTRPKTTACPCWPTTAPCWPVG